VSQDILWMVWGGSLRIWCGNSILAAEWMPNRTFNSMYGIMMHLHYRHLLQILAKKNLLGLVWCNTVYLFANIRDKKTLAQNWRAIHFQSSSRDSTKNWHRSEFHWNGMISAATFYDKYVHEGLKSRIRRIYVSEHLFLKVPKNRNTAIWMWNRHSH